MFWTTVARVSFQDARSLYRAHGHVGWADRA